MRTYKIVATTVEGVKFENELTINKLKLINVVFKLREQGLMVEVYEIKKLLG